MKHRKYKKYLMIDKKGINMKEKNEEKDIINRHFTEEQVWITNRHEEILKLSGNPGSRVKVTLSYNVYISNRQKFKF